MLRALTSRLLLHNNFKSSESKSNFQFTLTEVMTIHLTQVITYCFLVKAMMVGLTPCYMSILMELEIQDIAYIVIPSAIFSHGIIALVTYAISGMMTRTLVMFRTPLIMSSTKAFFLSAIIITI